MISMTKVDGKNAIIYRAKGVCANTIRVILNSDCIDDVLFVGGCNGNANAINRLIKDMPIKQVIIKLKGVTCGNKGTSCADQLVQCLEEYIMEVEKNEDY